MTKGTKMRYFRIGDDLWLPVKEQCAADGIKVSELVRGLLRGWLDSKKDNEGDDNE